MRPVLLALLSGIPDPLLAINSKTFASAATHEAHIKTKKHKDAVFKAAAKVKVGDLTPSASTDDVSMASPVPSTSTAPPPAPVAAPVRFESSGDASLDRLVAKRLQYAPPIPTSSCLFCPTTSPSTADNVAHMRHAHSFVIPEEEYLVDLEGLLGRLGEEVGTWNVCVCCGKGYGGNLDVKEEADTSIDVLQKRASKGVEAVRAHMQSKVRSLCSLSHTSAASWLTLFFATVALPAQVRHRGGAAQHCRLLRLPPVVPGL